MAQGWSVAKLSSSTAACKAHTNLCQLQRFTFSECIQEDEELLAAAKSKASPLRVIDIEPMQPSLELWEPICLKGDPTSQDVLLLLPTDYSFVDAAEAKKEIPQVIDILRRPWSLCTGHLLVQSGGGKLSALKQIVMERRCPVQALTTPEVLAHRLLAKTFKEFN